jgi:hypothetical protein
MKIDINEMYKTKNVARILKISEPDVRYRIRTGKLKANNVNENGKQPIWRIKGEWILQYEGKFGRS